MMVYRESAQGIILDITDMLLFGLVWLTTKYSNRKPNAVTQQARADKQGLLIVNLWSNLYKIN